MVKQLHISLAVLCLLAGMSLADDEGRDRKVRVALALAATEPTPTAPAPRVAELRGYAEAYRLAIASGEPLVVYVGCEGRHPIEQLPNVVVGATRELAGFDRGSVVISYPRGGQLFVHATLRCPDHGEPVAKAAEDARKKIAMPPAKPVAAPVPLNWNVQSIGQPCVCGSGCYCPSGVCPQRCPVVTPP